MSVIARSYNEIYFDRGTKPGHYMIQLGNDP